MATDAGERDREALLDALYGYDVIGWPKGKINMDEARALLRAHDARVLEEAAKGIRGLPTYQYHYRKGVEAMRAECVLYLERQAAALRALAPKGEKP